MTDATILVDALVESGAGFFTGVPDSLLSKFSACVMAQKDLRHMIAANEGNAVGLAIGEYLATGKPSVVYMQNSGLGNTVNPLTSLASPDVYGIPMMLIIGWRGEPGVHDEPQHVQQGEVTPGQLNTLSIPYAIVSDTTDIPKVVGALWQKMIKRQGPVALVVRKGALGGDWPVAKPDYGYRLKREEAIEALLDAMPQETMFVATTGKTGRELYELREKRGEPQRDFLTVGGMGHAVAIAQGIAQHNPNWTVCLDGDGAVIMHMGAMATLCAWRPAKFLHVLLNNCAHESVGGQPTVAGGIDFEKLSSALGYDGYRQATSVEKIKSIIAGLADQKGVWLLEIKLKQGARSDLGRPKRTPEQNKHSVMEFLKQC